MLTDWLDHLLSLDGTLIYLLVWLLVFAEDALFVGFVFPGETAAILGGVAASLGIISLPGITVVVITAAIAGDTASYLIGRALGPRLLRLPFLRRRQTWMQRAQDQLATRGGVAVFVGRFVTFFHAVMPALAGASHMPYRRFFLYNVAGGLIWGFGTVLIGYLAGSSYAAIEDVAGRAAAVGVAVLVIGAFVLWRVRSARRECTPGSADGEPAGARRPGDTRTGGRRCDT
ncbi:DedA family protein [Micromonospora sp. NBC_01813]|uniref:DedA family protein n=1 Tax=Micromonospora sp. NBC_01813 TaxID=2975988 RepID=UPI002DD9F1D9|nr:DedA family protein [Micromonospora sp. NBC_01813]WSA11329.1 DedA family protein [Micromonospora sp. NBC_01813]